jgi:hypothetical protein
MDPGFRIGKKSRSGSRIQIKVPAVFTFYKKKNSTASPVNKLVGSASQTLVN